MGYFLETKKLSEHNERIQKGESVEDLIPSWGKLTDNQYEIGEGGVIKFKNTPYAPTFKTYLASKNFVFVTDNETKVEEKVIEVKAVENDVLSDTVNDTVNDVETTETETEITETPKPKRGRPYQK